MNILVIRFTALGDLVQLEPLFKSIRFFYPDAMINFWTSAIGKGLYEDSTYFDHYVYENSFCKTVKKLKKKKYDIIFNLQCSRLSHIVVLLLNSKLVINKSHNFYQKFLKLTPEQKNIEMILHSSGIDIQQIKEYKTQSNNFSISLPKSKNIKLNNILKENFLDKKIIAIGTGASERWISKKWGKENFSKLVSKLQKDFGIILVGSKLEKEDAKYILQENQYVLDMTDKTSLNELKSLISEVDFFVGNDSGPTHIAAALGIPTITIFGSTSTLHCPKHLYKDKSHFCIKPSDEIKCHPCYKSKCPINHECMQNIKPEAVYEVVKTYFRENI